MALIDLMGRRWILRILWELREGALTFRALQSACGDISPSVLNQRIAELRASALIELGRNGYGLTPLAQGLVSHMLSLTAWAEEWAKHCAE